MQFEFFSNSLELLKKLAAVTLYLFLAACVSSKVEPQTTDLAIPSSQLSLSEDEIRSKKLREAAIAEIHAKAEASPVNENAPDNHTPRVGETSLLTPEQITSKINRIKSASGDIPPVETPQQVEARQQRIKNLRRKGRNHYNSALRNIEAE